MKKPVKSIVTLENENKELKLINERLIEKYDNLLKQGNQLKENFAKIRKNYDREKDRLDMALRALDNATNKL